jgi:ElaB/YqjD/DUF883 family membrane-anchored ribosome-binding protein
MPTSESETPPTLRSLISDLESLLAKLGDEGSQRYRDAVADLQRTMRRTRDRADDLQYATGRRARLVARQADRYAHDNPWATAAAAAALGAAAGALVALLVVRASRAETDDLP